jgi:hypothetical protein
MMPNALANLAGGYAQPRKRQLTPLEQAQREGEQLAIQHAQRMNLPPVGAKSTAPKQMPAWAGAVAPARPMAPKPVMKQPQMVNPQTSFAYRRQQG